MARLISTLNTDSSPGFDTVSAPFLRYACYTKDNNNMLVDPITDLFMLLLRKGTMPHAWAKAKVCPLHKKGDAALCGNYRLLAVNGTLYRMYANVLREELTEWCEEQPGRMPASQFGFYPGRGTTQAMFILRHIIHAAKRSAAPRVYAAFIDFSSAYDTIDRAKLWQHLEGMGVPPPLLRAVRGIYTGDSYVLIDGSKATAPIVPTLGVKQGCPLSPLLFALYCNDLDGAFQRPDGVALGGAVTGTPGLRVHSVSYADDLLLAAATREGLQAMLAALERYADRKGLVINASKSCGVVFNAQGVEDCGLKLKGAALRMESEFKYLGTVFSNTRTTYTAADAMAAPFLASVARVWNDGHTNYVRWRPHAMLQLFQTFAHSAGMYGCQVWGTPFLLVDAAFKTKVHRQHLAFLTALLGVKATTSSWAVLRETGQLPYWFYWFRACARFWNGLLKSNSQLLREVAAADAALARGNADSWARDMERALGAELGAADQAAAVRRGAPLDLKSLEPLLRSRCQRLWEDLEARPELDAHAEFQGTGFCRRDAVYARCFAVPWDDDAPRPPLPHYMRADVLPRTVRNNARMRLSSHTLRVETGRYEGIGFARRTCQRCSTAAVDDEEHALFRCQETRSARMKTVPRKWRQLENADNAWQKCKAMVSDRRMVALVDSVCIICDKAHAAAAKAKARATRAGLP